MNRIIPLASTTPQYYIKFLNGLFSENLPSARLPDDRVLLVYGYRHKPYCIRARILNMGCTDYDTAEEIVLRTDGGGSDLGYPWATLIDENTYYYNIGNGTRHNAGTMLEIE